MSLLFRILAKSAVLATAMSLAFVGCTPRDLQVASPEQRALIKQTGGKRAFQDGSKSEFFVSKAGLALHLIERQIEVAELLRVITDQSKSELYGYKVLNSTKSQSAKSFVVVLSKALNAGNEEVSSSTQEHFVADVDQKDESQFSVVIRSRGAFRQLNKLKQDSKIALSDAEKQIYLKCVVNAEAKNCYFEYYVKSQVKFSKALVSETYTLAPDITGMISVNSADEVSIHETDKNIIRLEEKNIVVDLRLNDSIRLASGACFPTTLAASLLGPKAGTLSLNSGELVMIEGDRTAKIPVAKCEERSAAFYDLEKLLEAKTKRP